MAESVLIVGAGVGGLTAGLALEQAGFEVEILEQADKLRTEGAGISLFQNALRCLDRLGLVDEVIQAGDHFGDGGLYLPDGRCLVEGLSEESLGIDDLPLGIALHRGRLVDILDAHLETTIEYGLEVVAVDATSAQPMVKIAGDSMRSADVIVGADGLHSVLRNSIVPDGSNELRYSGYTSWRGLAEWSYDDPSDANPGEYWGAGQRFGVVPIGDDQIYWFAVHNSDPDAPTDEPPLSFLTEMFGDWPTPIPGLLEATDAHAVIQADIYDRDPVDTWGTGCVTLLGDAAHPMTPDMGQGGCQAIEDAVVLADSLTDHRDSLQGGPANLRGTPTPPNH